MHTLHAKLIAVRIFIPCRDEKPDFFSGLKKRVTDGPTDLLLRCEDVYLLRTNTNGETDRSNSSSLQAETSFTTNKMVATHILLLSPFPLPPSPSSSLLLISFSLSSHTPPGWNPFYNNTKKTIETHILHDFGSDFYGSQLKVAITGNAFYITLYFSLSLSISLTPSHSLSLFPCSF